MRNIFQEWEIVDQVSAVITDNARNMRKSIEDLGLNVDHIFCIVHSLQLTLKTCIFDQEEIAQLLTACRGSVTHGSHSTTAVRKLKSSQRSTNLPEHVLIQDVQTRWDSTHQILKRLLLLNEQRLAIQDLLPSLPNCQHDITARQWALVQPILDVLGNFEDATKEFSKESTTLSQAIPIIQGIKLCLSNTKRNPSLHDDIIQLVDDMYEDLVSRFNYFGFNKNYLMATILDPRFKARLFSTREVSEMARSLLTAAVDEKLNKQLTKQTPPQEPEFGEHVKASLMRRK